MFGSKLMILVCWTHVLLGVYAIHKALPRGHRGPGRHRLLAERQQQDGCVEGTWSCSGSTLQRCVSGMIVTISECTTGTVCEAVGGNIGCHWPSVAANPPQPANVVPVAADAPPSSPNPVKTDSPVSDASASKGAAPAENPKPKSSVEASPGKSPTLAYKAPHYVMYADRPFFQDAEKNALSPEQAKGLGSKKFPTPDQLKGINRFVLCFWVPSLGGSWDNVKVWKELPEAERATILKAYHAAGIAVMISYGGETVKPTTNKEDPLQLATEIATFVKEYGLDGVDVDYEDLAAFDAGTGEDWVIKFQKQLRTLLPKPYLISHAPIAPWFDAARYKGRGYHAVEKAVGADSIDWYNIQYYNQQGLYVDCVSIFDAGPALFPKTGVFEIAAGGVPIEKLVVGKPISVERQNSGFLDFATLGTCVKGASARNWNAGIMVWDWDPYNIPGHAQAFAAARGGT